MKRIMTLLCCCCLLGIPFWKIEAASTDELTLTLDQTKLGIEISETLYGLFYEDINFAADGGLYAELVYNRSFEYENIFNPQPLDGIMGWRVDFQDTVNGAIALDTSKPLNENNEQSLNVRVKNSGFRLMNVGHSSTLTQTTAEIGIEQDMTYELSFYLYNISFDGNLSIYLENRSGDLISDVLSLKVSKKDEWKKYDDLKIKGTVTDGGRLIIEASGVGEFNLDMVSLMPKNRYGANDPHWKYGGLRNDLVQALNGLNPKFLRFPGGCVAEGAFSKENHYNWKDTIGPVEYRKENANLWGYMQSYGLGYHEYFQLAEDLQAEPVPVVHAGILCQARSGDLLPMYPNTEEFEQLTQDILDLIEYANGDQQSQWGKKRAENGHKEPFNLKYVAIGNENWGKQYWNNFNALKKAVQAIYPDITLVTSSGPHSEGWIYEEAWNTVYLKHKDTYVDEHYYNSPEWFLENTSRYDTYSRDSAKVFVGEFAAHHKVNGVLKANTLYSALTEGAYLTGIERNADVVKMISYAPLLARINSTQWTPDLIYFNAHDVVLTPNYYVLQLFSNHIGTRYLPTTLTSDGDLFHSVTVDEAKEEVYVKIVNPTEQSKNLNVVLNQFEKIKPEAEYTVVAHENPEAQNTITDKFTVVPVKSIVDVAENKVKLEIKPYSAQVLTIGYGNSKFKASTSFDELRSEPSHQLRNILIITALSVVFLIPVISHVQKDKRQTIKK